MIRIRYDLEGGDRLWVYTRHLSHHEVASSKTSELSHYQNHALKPLKLQATEATFLHKVSLPHLSVIVTNI